MSASLLLVPSFEVPDAFVELAGRIEGATTFEWPAATSAELADQELMAGPVLRNLLTTTAGQGPRTLVVLGDAAGVALSAAASSPVRRLLIDPTPHLRDEPPTPEEGMEALGKALSEVPAPTREFRGTAEGGDPEEAMEGVLDWLENDVMPATEDRYERRMMASRLKVLRRDGVGPPSDGPRDPTAPDWSEALRLDGAGSRTTVWLTSPMNRAGSPKEAIGSRGARHVDEVDLPMAWWWAAPERAVSLISRFHQRLR